MIEKKNDMTLNMNQLAAMLAVVDGGTFEAASRRLNLAQSTITKRIQELEASVGFPVFDRSKRRAILTTRGVRFVGLARQTLASFETLARFGNHRDGDPEGRLPLWTIKLGVTELSSMTWLPSFLERSRVNVPEVQFELTIDMSSNLLSDLEDGTLDLIVVPEMPFPRSTYVRKLAEVELTLIGKPGLMPDTQPIPLAYLKEQAIIVQGRTSGYSKSIRRWFADHGCKLENSVRVDTHSAMVGLAMAGYGLCVSPRDFLSPLIADGRLAEILTEPRMPGIAYTLAFMPNPHESLLKTIEAQICEVVDFGTPFFR